MLRKFSLLILLIYIGSEFFFKEGSHQLSVYLFLIWFVSLFLYPKWNVVRILSQRYYSYIYVFLIFYFISTFIGSNAYKAVTSTFYMVRLFSPVLMYDILKNETKKIRQFYLFILMIYVLWYGFRINGLIVFLDTGQGLRNLFRGDDYYWETMFAYIYSLPILLVTMITILRRTSNESVKVKTLKMGLLLAAIFLFVLTLRSSYMTAIILVIVGGSIALLYKRSDSLFKTTIKSSITILVLSVLFIYGYNRIQYFVEREGNEAVSLRVGEMRDVLTGNSSEQTDVGARRSLRSVSIGTFFSNPIVGVNHKVVGAVYNNEIVGNHAQWLDDLARYGIFAFSMFIFLFKALKKQYRDTNLLLPILLFVVTGFLNPLLYPISTINIFLLVPLLIDSFICTNNSNILLNSKF